MTKVLKSYLPFFVWMVLAACTLMPSSASASDDSIEATLQLARPLLDGQRWTEAARLPLRLRARPTGAGRPHCGVACAGRTCTITPNDP
jgi:hypothetical protein